MKRRRLPAPCFPLILLLAATVASAGQSDDTQRGKEAFETNCSTCHSLDLPRSQRLDRANWKWVIDDMVNKFGAAWITEEQQAQILDYLVATHGPEKR